MYKIVAIVLTVFLYLQNQITLQQANDDIKDKILEFFYNCTCTPLYLCTHINSVMEANRRKMVLKESINCTGASFICCNNTEIPEPVVTVPTTTTPKLEAANETNNPKKNESVEARKPVFTEIGCGIGKTVIGVRILSTDKESEETITGEAPWMVEVFQKKNNAEHPYKLKCAGSLIHKKVVLTANHCVVSSKPEKLKIVATGLENFQNVGVNTENERNVVKIIKHPKYYSGGLYNDIALLILDKGYHFSDSLLNAICLPNQNQSFDGGKCLALGWGENADLKTLPLKKVDVPVIAPEQCQNLLRKTNLGSKFNLHSSFICAGGEADKDTCKGDGGGPLMCLGEEKDRFVLSGLVSWGVSGKCGIVDQPGLYTNVAQFVDWINMELEKNNIKLNNN